MANRNEKNISRLNPELKINEETVYILDTKEFLIKSDNKQYRLKIDINNKYIYFNVNLTDRIIDSNYQNKYDLNSIVRLLNLIPNKYTNLNQVLKFIEKAYSSNKIGIVKDETNLIMTLNMPMGFEEEVYKLTLYKVILSNNDIINQIVKELNAMKKLMKANGKSNNDFNQNVIVKPNNDNINKKLDELTKKMNNKDLLIDELNKKLDIKDEEIKDIYNKLIDKDVAINEMSKTLKRKDIEDYDKERIESINQLKIKDEEINKKLNDKAFELNNKLIDRDNALNDINKKLIEKDYLINEITNKLESQENQIKRLNEQIKELKKSINKLLEDKDKIPEIKDLKYSLDSNKLNYNTNNINYNYKNNDLISITPKYKLKEKEKEKENINIIKRNTTLNPNRMKEKIFNNNDNKSSNFPNNNNDFNKGINEKILQINMKNNNKKRNTDIIKNVQKYPEENGNPNDLKFKYDLVNTNTKGGLNDIFEVFKSIKDNEDYLVSPNKMNFHLDLINLKNNKFYGSLKGHQKKVTSVRYFLNNYINNEYLISSDEIGIIFIWDVSDSYKKLFTLNTKYNDIIYSCLLIFTETNYESDNSNTERNNGYIIT